MLEIGFKILSDQNVLVEYLYQNITIIVNNATKRPYNKIVLGSHTLSI